MARCLLPCEVQDIRMCDLRRTLGSYMAISGISLPTIVEDAINIAAYMVILE